MRSNRTRCSSATDSKCRHPGGTQHLHALINCGNLKHPPHLGPWIDPLAIRSNMSQIAGLAGSMSSSFRHECGFPQPLTHVTVRWSHLCCGRGHNECGPEMPRVVHLGRSGRKPKRHAGPRNTAKASLDRPALTLKDAVHFAVVHFPQVSGTSAAEHVSERECCRPRNIAPRDIMSYAPTPSIDVTVARWSFCQSLQHVCTHSHPAHRVLIHGACHQMCHHITRDNTPDTSVWFG